MFSSILKFLFLLLIHQSSAKASDDCEVCIKTINGFKEIIDGQSDKSKTALTSQFRQYCKTRKGKENRFCYYVGGTEDAATSIINEVINPISYNMPSDKICEKLKKKDSQICELRYDKQIDLKTVDLKKLKVRDLRKILNTWDEICDGCIEKSEYIKRIEELKPKYMKEEL